MGLIPGLKWFSEGKNREIRKILASFNFTVVRLIRNRFGPFILNNLQVGNSKLKIEDYTALKITGLKLIEFDLFGVSKCGWLGGCSLKAEESPTHGRWCQLMAGQGNLRESATENMPPFYKVRVKR